MEKPLFSVLIASYNNGRYLEEAINSVKSQTYTNWEIIIVDDNSTDHSCELYIKYRKDERIFVYENAKNMGCGYTKRRCVDLAHGQLCGFLDPDDCLLPNALEVMVNAHFSRPDVSLVMSRYYNCDENMLIMSESRLLNIRENMDYFTTADYQPEHFSSFKMSYYKKTKGIDADKALGVDQDLYFTLEEVAPCMSLDVLTYKYRRHDGGISQKKNEAKALFWNTIIRYETSLRRGLPVDIYAMNPFVSYINKKNEEREKILKGYSYRIGHAFTRPIKKIRNIVQAFFSH